MNNGFNTEELIDPIDFYMTVFNNMNKFSDPEKLVILRFFDKMVDSSHFSYTVKDALKCHVISKNLKLMASKIFDTKLHVNRIELIEGVAYLDREPDGKKWTFSLGGKDMITGMTGEYALKAVKDINSVFNRGTSNKYNRCISNNNTNKTDDRGS